LRASFGAQSQALHWSQRLGAQDVLPPEDVPEQRVWRELSHQQVPGASQQQVPKQQRQHAAAQKRRRLSQTRKQPESLVCA
jgi:hypothetical protein